MHQIGLILLCRISAVLFEPEPLVVSQEQDREEDRTDRTDRTDRSGLGDTSQTE